MELSERMQVERYELGSAREDSALRPKSRNAVMALTTAMAALALLLVLATANAVEGWAHLVVIGGIVTTTIGLMIAIAPNRRA